MSTTSPSDAHLAYETHGTGAPIVFLHGLTFDRTSWRPIVDRLADRFTCISVDLPGHGDSAGPPRPLDEIAGDLHHLLGQVGVSRPVVVGHSIAANIASIYAATYPVAGVVNVDQSTQVQGFMQFLHRMEPALRGADFAAAFEPFRQSMGVERLPEPLRSMVKSNQTIDQDLVLGYWAEAFRADPEATQARIDRMLDSIEVPYLIVFGRQLETDERDYLVRHVRSVEIEEWPDCGHFVHLVEPNRFAVRVATFAEACTDGLPDDASALADGTPPGDCHESGGR